MNDISKDFLNYLANTNNGLGISVIMIMITIVIFTHLVIVQAHETATIRDFLTRYRVYILLFFVIFLTTLIPVGYYLTLRYLGYDHIENLRNLSTVSGRFGGLAIAIALELIYFYRKRDSDEDTSLKNSHGIRARVKSWLNQITNYLHR